MNTCGLRHSLLRGAMVCLLMMSVVVLGAAAKRSQYLLSDHLSYLARSVKMCDSRPHHAAPPDVIPIPPSALASYDGASFLAEFSPLSPSGPPRCIQFLAPPLLI